MSCVNEQSYGPLHLLLRLTTTGWQLYELCTRLLSIQYVAAQHSRGGRGGDGSGGKDKRVFMRKKISVCSRCYLVHDLIFWGFIRPFVFAFPLCLVLWEPENDWPLCSLWVPNMTVYRSRSWPQGGSKFPVCSQRRGLKKHRALRFTKDERRGDVAAH